MTDEINNDLHHGYHADYDLSETNVLETVIEIEDEDIEAIVIDAWIYFPFPDVAGVCVTVHNAPASIDLILPEMEDNLDHYSLGMRTVEFI